ncbi:MAG TPA: hypothetical protein VF411_10700 [Bacteroidia bacterium]
MANEETPIKKEQTSMPTAEDKKRIENHNEIATHLAAAEVWHREAVRHHQAGIYDKAAECIARANRHHCAATDLLKEDAK